MTLSEHYTRTRQYSVKMCDNLYIEDFIPQPVDFVSPPKWNLGHTTWFFEEVILEPYLTGYKEFNANYNMLFNSYYQSLGDRVKRANRGDLSRPTVKEVFAYRSYVDEHMNDLLSNNPAPEVLNLITIGINHEEQHQELFFTDIKYTFSLSPLQPAYGDIAYSESGLTGSDELISIEGGIINIGHPGKGFSYDNELPIHQTFIADFEISKFLVSNEEYLEFIENKGYSNPELWHDDGWTWIKKNNITSPMYWENKGGVWNQFTLAGPKKIQPHHPLTHITYYEAFAFAQWKGMRLPTEFEWEHASDKIDWGDRWEWTESAYLPYPGYKKLPGAIGEYNGKFMVNQKVLRGASVITPEGHERKTYRNFFHPHIGYQFNGIRLAK